MSIPDYQACMLPLLEAIADGQEHRLRDVTQSVAERLSLTDEERRTIEAELREAGEREFGRAEFAGRRPLAAALHRLWKIIRPRDDGWSVSNPYLGNLR